jgi:hypothetical protein
VTGFRYRPNEALRTARENRPSPSGSGRCMSRQELADAVNAQLARLGDSRIVDANYIGKLERGVHRWPGGASRWAFRAVLSAQHDSDLGFYIVIGGRQGTAETTLDQAARTADATRVAIAPTTTTAPDRWAMRPPLTDLLDQIDALARAFGLCPSASAGARRISEVDIGRLNAVTELYRSVDREYGGGVLEVRLDRLAEGATLWLDPARTQVNDRVRGSLAAAVADVRVQAGWAAFDAGSYEDSQRHFLLAERAAVLGGKVLLTAKIRYCQARQFQHHHHNADALNTLQFALDDLATQNTPAVVAMLHGTQAASHAALGHRRAALDCLSRADDAFCDIDPAREPIWMAFYDRGELDAQYGRVYRDLARHHLAQRRHGVPAPDPGYAAEAVRWVHHALSNFDVGNARSILLNKVSLCSAQFLAGEPDRALSTAADLIPAMASISSQRLVERVVNIRRDIPGHHRRSDVEEFHHMLSALKMPK